jgi:2-dehydropantoate 2-reductase
MRIAVFGTGSVGGYFGAHLARAGEDVTFIARGTHMHAIRTSGLHVETPHGEIVVQPAQADDNPARVGNVDVVLVGVKAWQVIEAAQAMQPLIGPDTIVVPLQNGVEAPAQLAALVGAQHVLGGLCLTFSRMVGPGRIHSTGDTHILKFAELDKRPSARVERLRHTCARAGITVEVPTDIEVSLWEKFLFVVSMGGVGAVTHAPIGVTRTVPETRRMLEQCMQEIYTVACARGVALPEKIIGQTLAFVDSLPSSATTSLQRDIEEGKPSELEAWNGAVVRLGRDINIETPLHSFIYHSLLPRELRARGQVHFP